MPKNDHFPPEGFGSPGTFCLEELRRAAEGKTVLEGLVLRCDQNHDLHLSLSGIHGVLPRNEVCAPWISGAEREISALSRVGKSVAFTVERITSDAKGAPLVCLSRKKSQEEAMAYFLEQLQPGDVLSCRVTHLAPFGAFLDIGRGIIALLPLESISVSRIPHPGVRFRTGQKILAVVSAIDPDRRRITMSHKELLGTWMENASLFQPGETVPGIVRTVMDYGSFIELSPNLSGLTDRTEGLHCGDAVSVYIKSIQPQRMKIKLHVIEQLPPPKEPIPFHYQITDGPLHRWVFSPPNYLKDAVETVFKEACP